jgi:hypothetical protein
VDRLGWGMIWPPGVGGAGGNKKKKGILGESNGDIRVLGAIFCLFFILNFFFFGVLMTPFYVDAREERERG